MARGGKRDGKWHASELTQCLRKSILRRRNDVAPDAKSILMWAVGFAMQEYFFGPEEDADEAIGILFSPDHRVDDHVLEFKTTRKSYFRKRDNYTFNPQDNDSWITRTGIYCALTGSHTAHIVVFFLFSSELHAYTLEFTDEDLEGYKLFIRRQKRQLDKAVKDDELPSVDTRLGDWECEHCPFYIEHCVDILKGTDSGEVSQKTNSD